jgi:hypothetical protein
MDGPYVIEGLQPGAHSRKGGDAPILLLLPGYFDESSEEIVNAIGMLQRRRSDRTRDEKSRAGIAKSVRIRQPYIR